MQESIGPKEHRLKMASLALQPGFAAQFKKLNRIQYKSAIDSYLAADPLIPSTLRLWLRCSKTRFVPLGLSKTILLNLLVSQSSRLLSRQGQGKRNRLMERGRALIKKTKIG